MKNTLIFILGIMICLSSCGSEEEELTLFHGEIFNDFHQRNVGKITFMDEYISINDYKEEDFLTSIELKEDLSLYMRFILEHTQTHYLNELNPELTPNELCRKGNWNLTFYVDDEKMYTENINPGAGSCWVRNEQTVIGVPLLDGGRMEHWGEFLWLKFLKRGKGESKLAKGVHNVKVELRPYLKKNGEVITGDLVASGEIMMSKEKIEVSEADIVYQSIQPTEEWKVSDGIINEDVIKELNRKIAQKDIKKVTSIAAVYKGELILEEYFNGADRSTLHDTRSVGKSFASTAAGIAISEGLIENTEITLGDLFPMDEYANPSNHKSNISLEDLLTMNSILKASDSDMDSDGNEEKMYPSEDWMKFGLDLPIDESRLSKKEFDYNSVSSVLVGGIVHHSVKEGLENYVLEKIFQPLGIKEHEFQYTPQKVLNTAGSIQLNTLDLAKYGQLYQNGGEWNGQQIVPKEWVEKSLSKVVEINDNAYDGYGYFFWNRSINHGGQSYEVAFASGNGGNQIIIFKDLPLVIVITARGYGQPWAHFQIDEIVEDYILPAIGEIN